MVLFGYYGILHDLMEELPSILPELRNAGCQIALDSAATGGTMQPLERILPHLDIYVPSRSEAIAQTGQESPERMVECYRNAGASGIVGVKLGAEGAVLSAEPGKLQHLPAATPPGPVVETVGAGDSFYAGLLTGLLHGMSVEDAGRLANAAGACCVTAHGASTGVRSFTETTRVAGL
jgi:sugar/nucleoside kinase (ribokinase family)